MKILIVSEYFPQYNSIASLRPYSWAKWWSRENHDVTVLTTEKRSLSNDLKLGCSGFTIISIPIPFFSKISQVYRKSASSVSSDTKSNRKLSLLFLLLESLKKAFVNFQQKTGCFSSCRYPDFLDLWSKDAIKYVKFHHFDMIISTGGPYSVHRVGLALKKKNSNVKWVLDWRDLWTKNHIYHGFFLFRPYERYLENRFHKYADLITTVSEPLADILRSMTNTTVKTIYNGFDREDFREILSTERKKNDVFTLVYTGTIYKGFQDPTPLFKAVANLKKQEKISSKMLKICFAGSNADVSKIAQDYGIVDFYQYLGLLPREEALKLQYDADAVLFLEFDNPSVPGILTGKLFEYLYISREILGIGVSDSTASGRLISDACAGICAGSDVAKIEEYLVSKIVNPKSTAMKKDNNVIQFFERKKQADLILAYLRETK